MLAFVLAAAASPAVAQYFGQNKVQYRSFDFKVLTTEHFDVYYYPAEREAAAQAARMAERWYARLSAFFDHELRGRQPLILYGSHPAFEQTNVIAGPIGEGTGGVTEVLKRRIVLPLAGTMQESDHVIGHELVHAFQYDITGREGRMNSRLDPGIAYLPLWFTEGMAEYLSKGPVDPLTAMWMRSALDHEFPESFGDLDSYRFFPYRYGQAMLAYIGGRWGDRAIADLLRLGSLARNLPGAVDSLLGIAPDTLVQVWRSELASYYGPLRGSTQPPETAGWEHLTEPDPDRTDLGPALSPDGKTLMYLSTRDLFSIDLYYADAETGDVLRRVTNTALDPHFQSLQYISSAGAWSPDGRRFAFAGVAAGRPVIKVYDAARDRIDREIKVETLGEIFNPTWSPDGRAIAFTGLEGGLTDLYLYDLETEELRQLTSDQYADLHPAWSPDGSSIAFVTDRFTLDLDRLATAQQRLALIDPRSGRITPLETPLDANHTNPEWAPGGAALYFIADAGGVPNVYRLERGDRRLTPVTNFYAGVSGITPLSPALSVAARSGRLAITVHQGGGFSIYQREGVPATEPRIVTVAQQVERDMAVLPPATRRGAIVPGMLADATTGLPAEAPDESRDYNATLTLDYIAPPVLAFGADRFGTYIGGGTAFFFSDLLGRHELAAGFQFNGGVEDLAAQVGYTSRRSRLNWGIVAQQLPIRTGAFSLTRETVNGQQAIVEREVLFRQTNRELGLGAYYPLSRADRVEGWSTFRWIGFDIEERVRAFSFGTGELIGETERDLDAPGSLTLGQASLAFVHDNAIVGSTSPIRGERARLEISPTIGSLDFASALVDLREYVMPFRPVTIAARLMHYGRYGGGAEDRRLSPLFLGYDGLVRGHWIGSFDANECRPTPDEPDGCPVFDRLVGSRIIVGNLEVRAPLIRLLGGDDGWYGGPLPLEILGFIDGGLAWDDAHPVGSGPGERSPVGSVGGGLRLNLFGLMILEGVLVRPFDRPGKGWMFQLGLQPGF